MKKVLVVFGLFIFGAAPLFASGESVANINALDILWILIAAFLVFFMQAGFGMVEAGLVRAKNAANLLMKNMMDFSIASIGFV